MINTPSQSGKPWEAQKKNVVCPTPDAHIGDSRYVEFGEWEPTVTGLHPPDVTVPWTALPAGHRVPVGAEAHWRTLIRELRGRLRRQVHCLPVQAVGRFPCRAWEFMAPSLGLVRRSGTELISRSLPSPFEVPLTPVTERMLSVEAIAK